MNEADLKVKRIEFFQSYPSISRLDLNSSRNDFVIFAINNQCIPISFKETNEEFKSWLIEHNLKESEFLSLKSRLPELMALVPNEAVCGWYVINNNGEYGYL